MMGYSKSDLDKKFKDATKQCLEVELLYYCSMGDLNVVSYLFEHIEAPRKPSIDANPYDIYDSPVRSACRAGKLSLVKYLMNLKPHPSDVQIALSEACRNGYLDIVQYFVKEHSLDVNERCEPIELPLYEACEQGRFEIVNYLINSPDIKNKAIIWQDEAQFDNFYLSCVNGRLDIIKIFLDNPQMKKYPADKIQNILAHVFYSEKMNSIKYFINHPDYDFTNTYAEVFLSICETGSVKLLKYFEKFYHIQETDKAWKILCNDNIQLNLIEYLLREKNWHPPEFILMNFSEVVHLNKAIQSEKLSLNLHGSLEEKDKHAKVKI